jgi:hypothetical protein
MEHSCIRIVSEIMLSMVVLSLVSAALADVAKYTDPGVQTNKLMEGGGYVIVSSLNVMPNKDLLCVFFITQQHAQALGVTVKGQNAILGRISKDSGRTWGDPFLVIDSPADGSRTAGDCTTVVSGKKVIVIASMMAPPQQPFEYGDIRLWQSVSLDNGKTWGSPREISLPRARPAVSGRQGITLRDGTILVPYWWDFMFQTEAMNMAQIGDIPGVSGTMISRDGGETWSLSTDVYGEWVQQPKILRTADEPAIVAVSSKDILMVLRSARDDGFAEETWSHDGGVTWELPKPGKLNEFNTPTGLWRMPNGWVVRMWNNSKTALRFPLAVSISTDKCRTWSAPRILVDFPKGSKWPTQASYPGVVEAADGSLVAVWCHVSPEGKWYLASGRFGVDWALGKGGQ